MTALRTYTMCIAMSLMAALLVGQGRALASDCASHPDRVTAAAQSSWFAVNETIRAANGRRWRVAYDVEIDDWAVKVAVKLRLVAEGGVTPAELERRKPIWKDSIENTWSGRFGLAIGEARVLPVCVSVAFVARGAHHTVIVKRHSTAADIMAWSLFPKPGLIVHEFGHMIGAFDEYPGGGTDPASPVLDPHSIMAAGGAGGGPSERHFWHVLRAAETYSDRFAPGTLRLVPLEPEG